MTYKGYISRVEFDERNNILVGKLLGIRDSVSFHADNVTELRGVFEEAVDDYLETCAKLSKPAEKSASGKMMLRVAPEIHSAALIAAQASGLSLNKWAADALARAAQA
jgi:predicted HicB family RNase H-like nuclease